MAGRFAPMPDLTRPEVDLIVPTFGNPELLRRCLRSIRALEFRNYRLIVVDDCGIEPALPVVQREHPGATVLRARKNGGLVGALNRGIRHGSAPFIALLNDDTEVSPAWLGELVECAIRNPLAGSIASKILLESDPGVFHSAGDGFGRWGMPFNRGVWLPDLGQYDSEEPVFGACAGAALYRRAALETVQLGDGSTLDPALWMYLEDVDLAWRLQIAGFGCVYQPSAHLTHHLSATGGGALASYQVSRNIGHILFASMPRPLLRRHWRRMLAFHLGRTLRTLRHIRAAEARASLRGTLAGLTTALISDGNAPRSVPPGLEDLLTS